MKSSLCALVAALPVLGSCAGGGSSGGHFCGDTSPCGGNITGTWKVYEYCIDIASTQLEGCPEGSIHGSDLSLAGTYTFGDGVADPTYSASLTLSGDVVLTVPGSCLNGNGTQIACAQAAEQYASLGYPTLECAEAGGGCSCTAPMETRNISEKGTYRTEGSVVTMTHGDTTDSYDYCMRQDDEVVYGQFGPYTLPGAAVLFTMHADSSMGLSGSVWAWIQ